MAMSGHSRLGRDCVRGLSDLDPDTLAIIAFDALGPRPPVHAFLLEVRAFYSVALYIS